MKSVFFLFFKYPGQVCCLGFLFQWTRDCEQAMVDGRTDRSALISIYRKTIAALNCLLSAKARDLWKNSSVRVTLLQRLRLEAMIAVSGCTNTAFAEVLIHTEGYAVKFSQINDGPLLDLLIAWAIP